MTDLNRLKELGFDVRDANEEQLAVLEALSDDEVALLLDIKRRLDDAGDDDVEGHALGDGGALCW